MSQRNDETNTDQHKAALKNSNIYAQLQRRADQIARMVSAEKQVEWFILVTKYRNLITREAVIFYDSLVMVSELLAPTQQARAQLEVLGIPLSSDSIRKASQWGNTKRDTIKQLTWQLDMQEDGDSYVALCPCCQRHVPPTRATWFIKPYYIASGFIKVCRECADRHSGKHVPDVCPVQCISVYRNQYINCYTDHDYDVAAAVFKEYTTRGIVFNVNIATVQQQADTYMAHVIEKLDSSMNKKKNRSNKT